MAFLKNKISIRQLREFGGEWTAERNGFNNFIYHGEWQESTWMIEARCHLEPRWPDDDDNFVTYWYITKDGKLWKNTKDPIFALRMYGESRYDAGSMADGLFESIDDAGQMWEP